MSFSWTFSYQKQMFCISVQYYGNFKFGMYETVAGLAMKISVWPIWGFGGKKSSKSCKLILYYLLLVQHL